MDTAIRSVDSRQYMRVPFKRAVRFHVADSDCCFDHVAQDLSQGGLRFISSEFFPVKSQVVVRIQLEDCSKVMDVEGRVVWVRYNPLAEVYQMGLEFMDGEAFERGAIGSFVRSI